MKKIAIYLLLAVLFASCMKNSVEVKQIKNISLLGFEYNSVLAQAEIEINNKYFLPINIQSANMSIISNNDSIGSVEIKKPVKIKARKQDTYVFDFRIKSNQALNFMSLMTNFLNNKSNFKLSGTFNAHSFIISRNIKVSEPLFK
jgi:PBP1b-binding outer membrane lipoprotein LpoB